MGEISRQLRGKLKAMSAGIPLPTSSKGLKPLPGSPDMAKLIYVLALITPLVEAPTPILGDATAQRLGQFVMAVLVIAGYRGEVALQPGSEFLEPR
jgi:hypothetical protein